MGRILIVDDDAVNRELIAAHLHDEGYTFSYAESGAAALELARADPPDLVLLDVMMPGYNGFETTRMLKQQADSRYLPIIMVTALSDQSSRVLGLRAGADEFISKPVNGSELRARVSNLLALRSKQEELERMNRELTTLGRFREEMAQLIVHDLKNPMTVIMSGIEFLQSRNADAEDREVLDDVQAAGLRMMRIIANLLDVTRLEAARFTLQPCELSAQDLLAPLVQQRVTLARAREISLTLEAKQDLMLCVDRDLMSRVLENLLDNALRHTPRGGRIFVAGSTDGTQILLSVGNDGPSVPQAARATLFEKFGQSGVAVGRLNVGLGLYFSRLAAEAHGGRIKLEDKPLPVVFTIELPGPART